VLDDSEYLNEEELKVRTVEGQGVDIGVEQTLSRSFASSCVAGELDAVDRRPQGATHV